MPSSDPLPPKENAIFRKILVKSVFLIQIKFRFNEETKLNFRLDVASETKFHQDKIDVCQVGACGRESGG